MSQTEESQRLLGIADQDEDSEDEQSPPFVTPPEQPPPPTAPPQPSTLLPAPNYNGSTPATLYSTPATVPEEAVLPSIDMGSLPPPPDYSLHAPVMPPKYTPQAGSGAAMPVNVHMDGRLVPATLMQDPSGNHMVYICEPQNEIEGSTTASGRPVPPKDHFGLTIVGLFCSFLFLPLAIMALIKSLEVHRRYKLGDYTGAALASKKAQSWGSASIVFGIFSMLLILTLRYFFQASHYRRYYY